MKVGGTASVMVVQTTTPAQTPKTTTVATFRTRQTINVAELDTMKG